MKRLAVFAAGVASNLIIGYLLLVFAFMTGWPDQTMVVDVQVPSPAHSAGLASGDTVLRVNGNRIFNNTQLRDAIYALQGQDVELVVLRDDITMSITITPRTEWPEGQGPAGFTTSMELTHYPFSLAFLRAAEQWALNLYELTILPLSALRHQFQSDAVRLVSPVGLKQLSDQAIENAASWNEYFPLLSFASAISIALGVTNLLPLPALDGGRMLFVFIEMIRRKAINPKREKLFHGVGLVALLGLTFVLVIQDIFNPLF
jgi:regulator of sigma E protease